MAVTAADRQRLEPSQRYGRATNRVKAAELRHKVITLTIAGATRQQIAKSLGIGETRVSGIINKTLDRWLETDEAQIDKVRALQLARLDALLSKLWPAATGMPRADDPEGTRPRSPNLNAVDRVLRIEALRARIAGTEAPRKVDVSGELGIHITTEQADALDATWVATGGEVIDGTLAELEP